MSVPVRIEDLYQIRLLSSLKASPSGKKAAYIRARMDETSDSYQKSLWLLEDGHSTCLLQESDIASCLWDEEDNLLIQRSPADGKTAFDRLSLNTREVTPAFIIPREINEIAKCGTHQYAFTADENIQRNNDDDTIVLTQIPFWDNGVGYISGKRNHLFLYKEGKEPECLLGDTWHIEAFAADEGTIVCAAQEFTTKKTLKQGIYSFDAETKEKTEILKPELRIDALVCDQGTIAFTGSDGKDYGDEKAGDLYLYDDKGLRKVLACEHYLFCNIAGDCHVGPSTSIILKNGTLYYLKTKDAHCRLYSLQKDGTEICLTPQADVIRSFILMQDGICTLEMDPASLEELYLYQRNQRIQVTNWNQNYLNQHTVQVPQTITFTNNAKQEVTGWILYPPAFDETKSYPGVLSIHGGPRCAFGDVFMHEMQMLASEGYIVFFTNPRGSDSFGEEYADLRGKYGTIDYEDLMDFTDAVLAKVPALDDRRLGVMGGSYGGFMTNWIIGHTNRFAAAASQRSVANWLSDFGTSCIGYQFDPNEFKGTPWTAMESLWSASPLAYADRVQTPTLFIHSLEDYNCPLQEGLQMFTALQYHDVESRVCLFPKENHELSRSGKPKHRITRLKEIVTWFNDHLK